MSKSIFRVKKNIKCLAYGKYIVPNRVMTFQHLGLEMINIYFSDPRAFLLFSFYEEKQNNSKIIHAVNLRE